MSLYPVFLDLSGQRVVVVGGGEVALRKARTLLSAEADVTVISPETHPEFRGMNVTVIQREFQPSDLEGARLAFACTNAPSVNDDVAREARERGVWCNHTSNPAAGNVRLGATVTRGGVQVAVSTGVELPYLSQALRDRVSAALPDHLPVPEWHARRTAALQLPEPQRSLVLETLKAEIRKVVGA